MEPSNEPRENRDAVPSALETLQPVIRELLSALRGASAAAHAMLLFADVAQGERLSLMLEAAAEEGLPTPSSFPEPPTLARIQEDFPATEMEQVAIPNGYERLWRSCGITPPKKALWIPLRWEGQFFGGIFLSGGSMRHPLSPTANIEVRTASSHLGGLLSQVIRLERDNLKLAQLIGMLRATRTLMRESEAGHLVNMTLSTLARIVGNSRLALFPTTVLGRYRTYIRHIDTIEAGQLHERMLQRLDPRSEGRVQGRQAAVNIEEIFPDSGFGSFSRVTSWVLRDAGRTYLGMLYLFDNDPAQEDTLTHAVIRTIVVELERTLRRYLIEDDAAHAVSDLPYRIWSREYWLRRFEEEINLTGRRGTRVACGILEILDYDRLLMEMDELLLKESILTFLQVVKASVRETDLICRLDRNHFGVLFLDAPKAKVLPALERVGLRLQQVVGGAAMAPRIAFVAGLAEFPWDGEGVPTLLRRAYASALVARMQGPFTLELYEHERVEGLLGSHPEVRSELEVYLDLLGGLILPASTEAFPPSAPEER
jgi:GGDEF domain-containing protein